MAFDLLFLANGMVWQDTGVFFRLDQYNGAAADIRVLLAIKRLHCRIFSEHELPSYLPKRTYLNQRQGDTDNRRASWTTTMATKSFIEAVALIARLSKAGYGTRRDSSLPQRALLRFMDQRPT